MNVEMSLGVSENELVGSFFFFSQNYVTVCHLIRHHRETMTGRCRDGDGDGDGQALEKGNDPCGNRGAGTTGVEARTGRESRTGTAGRGRGRTGMRTRAGGDNEEDKDEDRRLGQKGAMEGGNDAAEP